MLISITHLQNFHAMECPICFDEIVGNINIITTECGHTFHCKCLMHNASVNGFGCPMCRQVMVEEGKDDEDSDSDDEFDGEDSDDDDSDDTGYSQDIRTDPENLENHLLRGMRWLFQQNDPVESDVSVSVSGTHHIIPLDGNSLAITPVSMRRVNRRLEEEFNVVEAEEAEAEEEEVAAQEDVADEEVWQHLARHEAELEQNAMDIINSSRVPYKDLWKAYLHLAEPELFFSMSFEKANDKILDKLEPNLNRLAELYMQ